MLSVKSRAPFWKIAPVCLGVIALMLIVSGQLSPGMPSADPASIGSVPQPGL